MKDLSKAMCQPKLLAESVFLDCPQHEMLHTGLMALSDPLSFSPAAWITCTQHKYFDFSRFLAFPPKFNLSSTEVSSPKSSSTSLQVGQLWMILSILRCSMMKDSTHCRWNIWALLGSLQILVPPRTSRPSFFASGVLRRLDG